MKLSIAVAGCLAGLVVASALASTVAPVPSDSFDPNVSSTPASPAPQQTVQTPERTPAAHAVQQH